MKRLIKISLASITLLASTLACVTLLGTNTPEAVFPPTIQPQPSTEVPAQTAITCPVITEQIVDLNSPSSTEGQDGSLSSSNREEEILEAYLVTYVISNDEIVDPYYEVVDITLENDQKDTAKHEELWNYFATLIPYEFRPHLAEFVIMTDGKDNVLAAVAQTSYDSALWNLQIDFADTNDSYYLTFTLIHEFAHLLTLEQNQVPPSLAIFNNPDDNEIYYDEISACSTYHPGEGCSNQDSYINQFYEQFWLDIYEEWNEINLEEDEDLYYEKLDDFYYKYEDRFLTDYAATNPAEDIAESFAFFIFAEKPLGETIAEEKILFFYNYPELVDLRTNILSNICSSFPE
jgi:hypothetical protein